MNPSLQISLDYKTVPWDTGSHTAWSLWDLLVETHAYQLVACMETLVELREKITNELQTSMAYRQVQAAITTQDQQGFANIYDAMVPWLSMHQLSGTLDFLDETRSVMMEDDPSIQDVMKHLEMLPTVLRNELKRRIFLYVVPDDANLFRNPIASFGLTYAAYPSTRNDIREAGRCHALGCYTASVYHCMAVAQAGLHALAKELGVSFKYPMELAEWQGVIQAIESKIEPMRHLPRGAEKDALLTFYSECAVQFRYFKDAWRNHVAHMREVYDRDQSHSILLHVRDFMEKLSTQIKETYTPVR